MLSGLYTLIADELASCLQQWIWEVYAMRKRLCFLLINIVILCLFLAGCDKRHDEERDKLSFDTINSQQLFNAQDYAYLNKLLDNLTGQDLCDILGGSMETLNTLADQGYTGVDDYQTLAAIIDNLYNVLLEDLENYDPDQDDEPGVTQALGELARLAAENNVGDLVSQIIALAGPDLAVENIYPMLVYLVNADDETLKGAVGGISIGNINEAYFEELNSFVHDVCDPQGKYQNIHAATDDLFRALKTEELTLSVGDVKGLVNWLLGFGETTQDAEKTIDLEVLSAVMDALGLLWDEEEVFKEDVRSLLYSLASLMNQTVEADGHNTWDVAPATDFERLLFCIEDILALDRDSLRTVLESTLGGLAPSSDAQTLGQLLKAIAGVDRAMLEEVDAGLLSVVLNNMYAQPRDSADVKISSLRSLMFVFKQADTSPTFLGIPLLSMIDSPDGGTVSGITTNIAEWTTGEIATGFELAPPSADTNEDGEVDAFEAFDWLLYQKRYQLELIGIPVATYNGLVGIMTNALVVGLMPAGITDPFPSLVESAGGLSEYEIEFGFSEDSWKGRSGTAGSRHTLFALFAPLVTYYWDDGRPLDFTNILAGMNEIPSDAYLDLSEGNNATLRLDNEGVVFKAIEGPDGYGLITYALRGHDLADSGILDSLLDIVVAAVRKLEQTSYNEQTLFDALMDELEPIIGEGLDDDTIASLLSTLFDPDESSEYLLDKVQEFLTDNHDSLVVLSESLGDVLLAVYDNFDELTLDLETILPILKELIEIDPDRENTLGELIDYLLAEAQDGSDNLFVSNASQLLFKILDLQDDALNPTGYLVDESTLTEMLVHLLGPADGSGGLYNLGVLRGFLLDATNARDATGSLYLWALLGDDEEGFLDRVLGDEEISMSFIRALYTMVDVDGDGSMDDPVVLRIMKIIHLAEFDGPDTMNALLFELAGLLNGMDLKPGSATYTILLETLGFVVEHFLVD